MKTFVLPDLGEGLPDGEISEWHVKEGQVVKADDPLVSIETAKAIVEVPSPYSGKIIKLHGKKGDIIPTGAPLVDFEGGARAPEKGTVAGEITVGNEIVSEQATTLSLHGGIKILPSVRALAKKLNVNLSLVTPTGPEGTITTEDVKKTSEAFNVASPIEPLKGVRRAMAIAMTQSHSEVVKVTVSDDADITAWAKDKDYTVKIILAMIHACQKEASLNAWYDGKNMGRRIFSSVNLGLAMDTPEGLFVPVIFDAQERSAEKLREEIETLKKEVNNRTISPKKLQGATIVLSNFGKFAGRYADPIIVVPTVAILAVGAHREAVIPVEKTPQIRSILPLSLSFDHRAVTGGEATRFLAHVMNFLSKG